jgi:hypothetical protein
MGSFFGQIFGNKLKLSTPNKEKVTHNSGNILKLPNLEIAKQYQLPKGWYSES